MHFGWGKVHYSHPPWFSWPSILVAKLPLALLMLALAGLPLAFRRDLPAGARWTLAMVAAACRSEEHTSELQSLMRISYAVFCLKKKINKVNLTHHQTNNDITR